jgi:hypothetical protein
MAKLVERGFEVFAGGFGGFFDDCGGGKIGENNRPLLDSIFWKFLEYALKVSRAARPCPATIKVLPLNPSRRVLRTSRTSRAMVGRQWRRGPVLRDGSSAVHDGCRRIASPLRLQPHPAKQGDERTRRPPGECSGSSDLVACILGACDFAGERRSKAICANAAEPSKASLAS